MSVFWIFDVHKKGGNCSNFDDLKNEYTDLPHTLVLLTDCKCSSCIDTGVSKNGTRPKIKKTQNRKNKALLGLEYGGQCLMICPH
ncbi:hypothetical protein NXW94_27805 [Bacteroides ovatus]|nr:hypothetical protein [Bacteroides ovatus]